MTVATVVDLSCETQETWLREIRQARYGHLLALHILLLLARGKRPAEIADFLLCSRTTVYRSVAAYEKGELACQRTADAAPSRLCRWQKKLRTLLQQKPRVFGWCRTRWSCACLALTLARSGEIKLSRETIRQQVQAAGYVWKRAKHKAPDKDPQRAAKLAQIRDLFENQRPDELILFADELDIDLLPKLGYHSATNGCSRAHSWKSKRRDKIRSLTSPPRSIRAPAKCIASSGRARIMCCFDNSST